MTFPFVAFCDDQHLAAPSQLRVFGAL